MIAHRTSFTYKDRDVDAGTVVEELGVRYILEAWVYALKGNVRLFNPEGPADFREAKALIERAVALDPGISSAWSGLDFVHFAASLTSMPGISVPDSKDLSLRAAGMPAQ